MTNLNKEICELSIDELDTVTGGSWFGAILGVIGNVTYDIIKKESETGFVANAVTQTGNTPGK